MSLISDCKGTARMIRSIVRTVVVPGLCSVLMIAGCVQQPSVRDLQQVFGPRGFHFEERTLWVDLNGDGHAERLVLLVVQERGPERVLRLPESVEDLANGALVDAFAVFSGRHHDVCIFYQFMDFDGFYLRLDDVDGQRVLVSDGGRDRMQYVWGWQQSWHGAPPAWNAKVRVWDEATEAYGHWSLGHHLQVHMAK